jgi:hypothetical protein
VIFESVAPMIDGAASLEIVMLVAENPTVRLPDFVAEIPALALPLAPALSFTVTEIV